MFIAMNRFSVVPGKEDAFEALWRGRESHLEDVPGFLGFNIMRGPKAEDHTVYASHTAWASRADFEAWTRSEAFRAAHKNTWDSTGLYVGRPKLELFESIQEVRPAKAVA